MSYEVTPNNMSYMPPSEREYLDNLYTKEDTRDWRWYNYLLGSLDEEYQRFKGWWVAMHIAVVIFVVITFGFAIAWRVQDSNWAYHTLVDLNTDFLTDEGVVLPARVAQQINLAHDQSIYVASLILTLATIMFGIEIVAVAFALWGAIQRDGFGLYLFHVGFRTLFNSVGYIDTSLWVSVVGLCTDWVMWFTLGSIYGERSIWSLFLLSALAVSRGLHTVTFYQDNSLTTDEARDPDREYRPRNTKWMSGVSMITATILGQIWLMVYLCKFPADPRPSYYLPLGILFLIVELLQYVGFPALRFILRYRWYKDQRDVLVPWDPYSYDMCLWLFQVVRFALVVYLVRFGDTGHVFVPRWGFAL